MKAGKLPSDLLARLLARLPEQPDVLLGPGVGRDAAAIDLGGGRVLVAKADPVTFATEEIGRYAVHVNANDIACLGAQPRWFMATVLLPEQASEELAEQIFEQIRGACAGLHIAPVGGHTEITIGLDRPIVAGAMLGEVATDELVRPGGARPGDHVVLTKGVAIEGTAVLALDAPTALLEHGVDTETIAAAARLLVEPGISVVRDAAVARAAARVHALHDPTEGGLATGVAELAAAGGVSIEVRPQDVPVLGATRAVCERTGIDPLGLLASGALLIAVGEAECDPMRDALWREGITSACIGHVAGLEPSAIMQSSQPGLPAFERDELARFLEGLAAKPANE